jgi:hypothetical protein
MSTASLHLDSVREVIADVLSLPGGPASLQPETALRFGITIEDGEISADLFETVASVVAFVARKVPAAR